MLVFIPRPHPAFRRLQCVELRCKNVDSGPHVPALDQQALTILHTPLSIFKVDNLMLSSWQIELKQPARNLHVGNLHVGNPHAGNPHAGNLEHSSTFLTATVMYIHLVNRSPILSLAPVRLSVCLFYCHNKNRNHSWTNLLYAKLIGMHTMLNTLFVACMVSMNLCLALWPPCL